jgi:L-alanine-DL-glutamate epimerase-like enolase superfamily enzyme
MADDLLKEPLLIENGHMRVPDGPGIGIDLDPEKVAKYRVDL